MVASTTTRRVLAAALACSLLAATAAAQDGRDKLPAPRVEPSTEQNLYLATNVSFLSTYYFRGFELYPETSIQPSVSLLYDMGELGMLGASVWAHIPAADDQQRLTLVDGQGNVIDELEFANKFVEVDPAVSYDLPFEWGTVSVGHIWYTDPDDGTDTFIRNGQTVRTSAPAPDSAEAYWGLSLDIPSNPQFTAYHDYRRFDQTYYSLEFSQRIDEELIGPVLGEGFNVTPSVLFGFVHGAEKQYNDPDGLAHINVGLSSNVELGRFLVTPMFVYVFGLDEENADGSERTDNQFIFGVDLALNFEL